MRRTLRNGSGRCSTHHNTSRFLSRHCMDGRLVSMDAANGMIIMTVVGFCLGIAAQRLWDSCASKKAEECTANEVLIPHVFINKSALKRLQQGHTDDPGITHLFTHCGAWRAESTALSVCGKCKHKLSIRLS